jgi:hypothetical protein
MDNQRANRKGSAVSDNAEAAKRSLLQRFVVVLALPLFVVVVIYGPLVAIYAEWKLFGSSQGAEFLQAIGVLDVLEFIYDNTPGIRN